MIASERLTILTGASRGLGRAMAQQLLAQSGATLVCISRRSDDALAELARQAGASLEQWELDLSEPALAAGRLGAWLQAVDPARFARATLINNAGTVGQPRPLADGVAAELAQALRVGLEAPMLLAGAFLGATRDWTGRREVLNISSGLGRNAMGSQAPYCAAKARRNVEHLALCAPALGGAQERCAEQQRRLQPHAHREGQGFGVGRRERARVAHGAGVVDQCGLVETLRVLLAQPLRHARRRGHRVGQVDLPLFERHAARLGFGGELGHALARQTHQHMARLQQLLGHGTTHATRGAGQKDEMGSGHVGSFEIVEWGWP